MREINDIFYTQDRHPAQVLDLLLPEGEGFPVLLYFHGGGLESGSRKDFRILAEHLAARGVGVATADYRMYPTAAYPDYLRDAAAAAAWLKSNIGTYGGNGRVYIGGSSAGGYISMMLCFDPRYFAPYHLTPTDFAGYVHDAGQPTVHFNVLRERGMDERRIVVDEAAPVYYVGCAKEYAPMLFMISDHDAECRHEQTEMVRASLAHFGYDQSKIFHRILPGRHGSYCNQLDENGESVFGREILAFIRTCEKAS